MRKTFFVAIIALLVLGVGGYFGFKLYVAHEARQQFEALLAELRANGIEAEGGEVEFDLFDGRLQIRDLSLKNPSLGTFTLESFLATGLDRPSPSRIFADRITLTNAAFDGPMPLSPGVHGTYHAAEIVIDKAEGPSAFGATGTSMQIMVALLDQLTADRIRIPSSTARFRSVAGNETVEMVHGETIAAWLNKGQLKEVTVEPSKFRVTGAPDTAGTGTIGKVTAQGVDLTAGLVLLDPDLRKAGAEFRTAYGSVTIDGYEVSTDNGFSQSWSSVDIRDVAVKPAALPINELMQALQHVQQVSAAGAELSNQATSDLMHLFAQAYDGLRLGGATLTGMKAAQPDGSRATLQAMRIGPFDEGRLSAITFEDFEGTEGSDRPFKFDRMSIAGLRPGVMARLIGDAAADPNAAGDIGFLMQSFGFLSGFELSGAEASVEPGQAPAIIDKLAASWQAAEGALPTKLSATLRLSGPTDAFGLDDTVSQILPGDVTRASVAFDLGAIWNQSDQTVAVTPVYLEVSDAFSFSASLGFGGVGAGAFASEPASVIAAALAAHVTGLDISLADFGLYDQKLNEAAKEQGMDPATIRQLLAGFAQLLMSQTIADRPELDPALQSLVAFLQKPMGKIALRVTPRSDALTVLSVLQALQEDPTTLIDEVDVEVIDTP